MGLHILNGFACCLLHNRTGAGECLHIEKAQLLVFWLFALAKLFNTEIQLLIEPVSKKMTMAEIVRLLKTTESNVASATDLLQLPQYLIRIETTENFSLIPSCVNVQILLVQNGVGRRQLFQR